MKVSKAIVHFYTDEVQANNTASKERQHSVTYLMLTVEHPLRSSSDPSPPLQEYTPKTLSEHWILLCTRAYKVTTAGRY
jgi:hypothetical protein